MSISGYTYTNQNVTKYGSRVFEKSHSIIFDIILKNKLNQILLHIFIHIFIKFRDVTIIRNILFLYDI